MPGQRGHGHGTRPRRRTTRQNPNLISTETVRPPRRQRPWPGAFCRYPEVRPAARPWGCARREKYTFCGPFRKSTISRSSSFSSSAPATSANVTFFFSSLARRVRALPNLITDLSPPTPERFIMAFHRMMNRIITMAYGIRAEPPRRLPANIVVEGRSSGLTQASL